MKKLTDQEMDTLLFTALSTSPTAGLSMDFSDKLRRTIKGQQQRKNKLRFYLGWAGIFIVTIAILLFVLLLIDKSYQTNIVDNIIKHKWFFITGFALIFLIQYLDHMVIKQIQFKKMQPQQK